MTIATPFTRKIDPKIIEEIPALSGNVAKTTISLISLRIVSTITQSESNHSATLKIEIGTEVRHVVEEGDSQLSAVNRALCKIFGIKGDLRVDGEGQIDFKKYVQGFCMMFSR